MLPQTRAGDFILIDEKRAPENPTRYVLVSAIHKLELMVKIASWIRECDAHWFRAVLADSHDIAIHNARLERVLIGVDQ